MMLNDPETCSWCTEEVEDADLVEMPDGARICPACVRGETEASLAAKPINAEHDEDNEAFCEDHGWQPITESGSNAGFTGATIYWANLACGCTDVDDSNDTLESVR